MIWVDCEMTGLDITKDKLIEIAVVVTDKDLNILAQGKESVKAYWTHWTEAVSARNLGQVWKKITKSFLIQNHSVLAISSPGPNLVIHQSKDVMDNMNEWCINQHGLSGLTQRVLDSKIDEDDWELGWTLECLRFLFQEEDF